VEFVRRNPIWFLHLTQPQWLSILSLVAGVVLIIVYGKRPAVHATPTPISPAKAQRVAN